ncbi:unnamed protein product [Dicrocoelium dendriticum]|nr:unnamed protein product [Dicrocoelium dendriticum]
MTCNQPMRSILCSFLVLLFAARVSIATYEDARCKCACVDRSGSHNGTKPIGKIYVRSIAADQCTCAFMLGKDSALCPYCDCMYQVRNTTTIKVVVCLILVIISALTLYMGFLLLLEPLLSPRRRGGRNQISSESHSPTLDLAARPAQSSEPNHSRYSLDLGPKELWTDLSTGQQSTKGDSPDHPRPRHRMFKPTLLVSQDEATGSHRTTAAATGVSTMVRNVRDQQQRWKGNVEAQRARVFQEHTLLN